MCSNNVNYYEAILLILYFIKCQLICVLYICFVHFLLLNYDYYVPPGVMLEGIFFRADLQKLGGIACI